MVRYNAPRSEYGNLFGLNSSDLPIGLLPKINLSKLFELLSSDHRVSYIISNKLSYEDINNLHFIANFKNEIKNHNNILEVYNKRINNDGKSIIVYRGNIVIWDLLNEQNKMIEIQNWIKFKTSIVNESNVDYEWLDSKYPDVAEQIALKLVKQQNYHYIDNSVKHMIRSISERLIDIIMPQIFKNKDDDRKRKLIALGNPNLKEEYTLTALRIYAKTRWPPTPNAKINANILNKLPTITRLEVIEKLINSRVEIIGIKTEDNLKELLFGAVMRYPSRVESIIKTFNIIRRDYE